MNSAICERVPVHCRAHGVPDDELFGRWHGRYLSEVPARHQSAVFEWMYGAPLPRITRYAEQCAQQALTGHLRHHADDIASRVADDLVLKPLPARRVGNWRGYVEANVRQWKVKEVLRKEGAKKRDWGHRVDDPEAVGQVPAHPVIDGMSILELREFCATLIARLPERFRPVFHAIFAVSDDGFDRRTIVEVAALLEIPDGTVRRISSQGMPLLRGITRSALNAVAQSPM